MGIWPVAAFALVLVAGAGARVALSDDPPVTPPPTFTPTSDDFKGDTLKPFWHTCILGDAQNQESSVTVKDGALTLVAGGSDMNQATDNGIFLWQPANGDFQATLEIRSLTLTDQSNKLGIMVRPSIDSHDATAFGYAMVKGFHVDSRAAVGVNHTPGSGNRVPVGDGAANIASPYTLRLTRKANDFTWELSSDGGKTFGSLHTMATPPDSATVTMPDDVLVGIGMTSHSTSQVMTAVLGPFTFTQTTARPSTMGLVAATATDANGAPVAGSSLVVKKGTDIVASSVTTPGPSNTASFFLAPGLYTVETSDTDKNAAGTPVPFEVKTAEQQEFKVKVGTAK
jgi:hypothetical protein